MAEFTGVDVEKLQGGLGRLATGTDSHFALVVGGLPAGSVATAINNAGKGVVIASLYAAEQLGINESFDANNSVTLHYDIKEFFRLAPEATLYLFNSVVVADLKAFINQNKEIKGYGFTFAFTSATPNLVSTINAHQGIINALAADNRFIDFCFVGANGLTDFTQDLFLLTAPNVSVFISCETSNGKVAIGSALGMQAVRMVNENLGSVDIQKKPLARRGTPDYSLTDETGGNWVNAYLTNGTAVNAMANEALAAIIAKGYIVAGQFEGYGGFFFENSYTCIARNSDFAFVENNRVWNKAARIIRATLIPRVKGVVKKETNTGFIRATTATAWTTLLEKNVGQMEKDDEISGFEIYINPKQIVNNTSPVVVKASIVADGIVHNFNVQVGLTNSI